MTATPSQGRRRFSWWWVVVAAVVVAGLVQCLHKGTSELPVYVLGGERMAAGAEIYRTSDLKPFTYPPFFALPFVAMPWLGESAQRVVWYLVNVLVLWWIVRVLHGVVAPMLEARVRRVFWVALALVSGRHVLAVFENQSHDLLVTACVVAAAAAWSRARTMRAGLWAGLGAACKATPALFAVPFVLQRSWPAIVGAAFAGVGATVLPDLLLPRADGHFWVQAWIEVMLPGAKPGSSADLGGTWHAGSILNQGLAGTLYRLTTPTPASSDPAWAVDASLAVVSPEARKVITLVGQILVLALVGWACRPGLARAVTAATQPLVRLAQVGAVACGMVLLSPMSSKSHFAVLLVPLAAALVAWLAVRRDLVLTVLLVAVFALGTLLTKGLLGARLGNVTLAYGSVTWTTLLALLASLRAQGVARGASDGHLPHP